jgi:signal transduction histidine kinase
MTRLRRRLFSTVKVSGAGKLRNTQFVVQRRRWGGGTLPWRCNKTIMKSGFVFIWWAALVPTVRTFGQTPIVDSLRGLAYAAPASSAQRLNALLQLFEQRNSVHPDSLMHYVKQAPLAAQVRDEVALKRTELFRCYALMGTGKTDSAIAVADAQMAMLEKLDVHRTLYVRFAILRSRLFIRQNEHRKAIDVALAAMARADTLLLPSMQMQSRNAMGLAHMEVGNNREAINWFLKGVSYSPTGDTLAFYEVLCANLSSCYNNIGKFDSALYFAKLAKTLALPRQNLSTQANILNIEADIFLNLKQPARAAANLTQALAIRQRIGDLNFLLSDMAQLAVLYAKTGNAKQGIALATEALKLANANKLASKKIFILQALAENYSAAKNFEALSRVQTQLMGIKDSLFEQNSAQTIAALQTRYDLEKSNNTILIQKIDLQNSRFLLYALLGVMVLGGMAAYFFLRDGRRRQLAKLERAVEEEKRAAVEAVQQAEERERLRIAADLHDNLGVYAAALASNLNYIPIDNDNPAAGAAVQQVRENALAIVAQLNDTIWVLNKHALLLTAISDRTKLFLRQIGRSYPALLLDCDERIETNHLLPASQAFHLYRILQEAVNNAIRHSGGKAVAVRFLAQAHWLVTVTDNGMGFFQTSDGQPGGNGLASMRQRCEAAGWHIHWYTPAEGGTVVTIASTANWVLPGHNG